MGALWAFAETQVLPGTNAAPDNVQLTDVVRRGIVIRKAALRGRVLIAAERRDEDERPADKVKIEIREKNGREVLERAESDEEGYFTLAEREPEEYQLLVGGLTIRLIVEPAVPEAEELTKIAIFVLPRKMAYSVPR